MPKKQTWTPLAAIRQFGPPPAGTLFPHGHAVYRVDAVRDDPDGKTTIDITWMGGRRPSVYRGEPLDPPAEAGVTQLEMTWGRTADWYAYPGTTWPACACCAEPMPCRKELDAEAAKAAEALRARAYDETVCIACGEPIKARQRIVVYPGENLLVPGAPPARFHAAEPRPGRFAINSTPDSDCRREALDYERLWQAGDPRRPPLAGRPRCPGWLTVHLDGFTVCRGDVRAGSTRTAAPGCMGEMTHRHDGGARYCSGNCGRPSCAALLRAQRNGQRGTGAIPWTSRQRWTLADYQRWELPPDQATEEDTLL